MELTDVQKQAVAKWVAEKRSIGEIQKLLQEQFQISMKYIDVRFLLIDLGMQLQDRETKAASPADLGVLGKGNAAPDAPEAASDVIEDLGPAAAGGVKVEIDRIMKPGALVSGTVKFTDGVSAVWMLDQYGRLALDASRPGYRPSQEDLQAFQAEVGRELQKKGF